MTFKSNMLKAAGFHSLIGRGGLASPLVCVTAIADVHCTPGTRSRGRTP
jgi:hypothetical protein